MSAPAAVDGQRFMYEQQSENDFMVNVRRLAKATGFLDYHTHIAKNSADGWPDLALCRRGVMVYAELKREIPLLADGVTPSKNKDYYPTPAQQRWLDELTAHSERVEARCCQAATNSIPHPLRPMEERMVQVYLWRPSSWEQIERVLR